MADGIQIWSRFPSTLPDQNRRSLEPIIDPLKGDLSIPAPKPLPFKYFLTVQSCMMRDFRRQ